MIIAFASYNIFGYVGFHIHSALADVNLLIDSHTSNILEENLPK